MGNPISRGAVCMEGVFEPAMASFNEAVGLRMECFGVDVGNVEEMGKISPEGGNKLMSAVRCGCVGEAKTGNPG
jgi:hypothetical protein